MPSIIPETIQLSTGASATIFPTQSASNKIMFYFHGGGLIYGSKSDLPNNLLKLFVKAGYQVIAMDYPLLPNTSLEECLEITYRNVQECLDRFPNADSFALSGRSAGAYLMFLLTKELIQRGQRLPKRLINFYGYTDLNFYLKELPTNAKGQDTPLVPTKAIETFDLQHPLFDNPQMDRLLLYMYARQNKMMLTYYQVSEEGLPRFALDESLKKQLPPTFSSASINDDDVPFIYSKRLKRLPDSLFYPLYDLPHDFLANEDHPQVQEVLKKLANWLSAEISVEAKELFD